MCIEITGFNVEVLLGVKSIPADCPWGQELVCAQSDEHMADFEGSQVNIWQSILFFFFIIVNLLIQCFPTKNAYHLTL